MCPRRTLAILPLAAATLMAAELHIAVTDQAGKPLWARLEVRGADGKMYQPSQGAILDKTTHVWTTGADWYKGNFVVEGSAVVQVPPGMYTVVAEHGPEFERAEVVVNVTASAPANLNITLRPWIRMNELGWFSGDTHLHRPLPEVPALMKTEDLNVGISYTMWNTEDWSRNAWADKPAPREPVEVIDASHIHMFMNAEDERGGGAWMLLGLPGPFDMQADSGWYPQGLRFVERARALKRGGVLPWFESEKLIWWEVPVMMALGSPDSVSILFNHYNQYGIHDYEAWGKERDKKQFPGPDGFVNYVLGLHYRYLNLGFRFALTGGSASGVLQGPVGYNRVYVKTTEPLTPEKWFGALKNGESFVTNGPMLFTSFRRQGNRVEFDIDARSREPIDRIEVVANGTVIETVRPTDAAKTYRGTIGVDAGNYSWMAVRCWQKDVPSIRLAHSMPFYLDGKWDASDDARYFINWIDELIGITKDNPKRFKSASQRDEVLAVYEKAKAVYAAKAGAVAARLQFRDIKPVDAHAHVFVDSPEVRAMLDRENLRFVNITVVDPYEHGYEKVEPQHAAAIQVNRGSKGRAPWIATFDPAGFERPDFAARVKAELDTAFRQGAIGVKIYKTIGMDLRDKSGAYIMPDHPAFAPILDFIAERGKTLYAHIAEPIGAWRPLDPADPDSSYYRDAPRWHMFGKPGKPAKEQIIAGRDRMLAAHPKLRVIGCHLGSNEEDVDQIAARLDKYPNYAVDTSGRVTHLALQPREKVRAFLIKYQDRILYATDDGAMPGENVPARVNRWEADLLRDWKFFATSEQVEYMDRKVQGLSLPDPVLRKIFRENVEKWVPGAFPKHVGE